MAPLNNVSSSGKPLQTSIPSVDDIPVALRDTPVVSTGPGSGRGWLIAGLVGLAIALLVGLAFALLETRSIASRQSNDIPPNTDTPTAIPPSAATVAATPPPTEAAETLLNHFPYTEAPPEELQPVTSDGSIKMRKAAAEAFQAMQAAAQSDGVLLVPLSAFRTKEDQQHLFFDVKAERGQVATKRAEVSAPPGYSEHHTGYAVDIGDGNVSATNVSPDFENTAAFKWLETNAPHYSFEISFPQGNSQGVSYEPWHWRYVGDIQSLETFYKARGEK